MNLSVPQSTIRARLVFSNVPFQWGAIKLQVYSVEETAHPRPVGSPVLIQPPVIQSIKRSTSYPTSPLKIRNVTPRVVGVVST